MFILTKKRENEKNKQTRTDIIPIFIQGTAFQLYRTQHISHLTSMINTFNTIAIAQWAKMDV